MTRRTITLEDPRHGTKRGYNAGCRRGFCPLPERQDCTHAQHVHLKRWRLGQIAPLVDATGTRRRVQALSALGWSQSYLGERFGVGVSAVQQWTVSSLVQAKTATSVRRLYDELSMTPGPSARARGWAAKRGWPPPLAWDDDTIDDPAARPYRPRTKSTDDQPSTAGAERLDVDEVLVLRALRGERTHGANRLERAEVLRRWTAMGRSVDELNRRQGWNVERDQRAHVDEEAA